MLRLVRNTSLPLLTLSVLLLSACGQKPVRTDVSQTPASSGTTEPQSPAPAPSLSPPAASPASSARAPVVTPDETRQFTGVAVCDEYLASYRACHRVLAAYDPSQIDERLETLRATWQSMAAEPSRRDALAVQCQNLTDIMKEGLAGRACESMESDFVQPGD